MTNFERKRILGSASLADVRGAFTLRYPDGAYTSSAEVREKGDTIRIKGDFYASDGTTIGYFERSLRFERACGGKAIHEMMELESDYRDKDIAKYHYGRVLRFYEQETKIRIVELLAGGDGPYIWPQLGFNLKARHQRERLAKVAREAGITDVQPQENLYASDIVTRSDGDVAVGVECLKSLARLEDGDLPMILRFDNPTQRGFLVNRGILPRRSSYETQFSVPDC